MEPTHCLVEVPSRSGLVFVDPVGSEIELAETEPEAPASVPVLETPILKPGTFKGSETIKVTLADLQQMADSYDAENVEAAVLNFDHSRGGPAHGWITKLWISGQQLCARIENLSEEAVQGIRSRKWTRRSAEIEPNHPDTGGMYLRGLALLGNASPAVRGLPPITLSRPVFLLQAQSVETKEPSMSEQLTLTAEVEPKTAPAAELAAPATPDPANVCPKCDTKGMTGNYCANCGAKMPGAAKGMAAEEPPVELSAREANLERGKTELSAAQAKVDEEKTKLAAERTKVARLGAVASVATELAVLGAKLTPAMRKHAEPLLIELRSAEQQATICLAAGSAPVALADAVLAILAAAPEFAALSAGQLATESADAAARLAVDPRTEAERRWHQKWGLTDARVLELSQKFLHPDN